MADNMSTPVTDEEPSPETKPKQFSDLPNDVMLEIFHTVALNNSWAELISLASTSKQIRGMFMAHRLAILRRAVITLMAQSVHHKKDPFLAEFVIKMGVLRMTTPWPIDVEEIRQALDDLRDITTTLNVEGRMYGPILSWVRECTDPAVHQRRYGMSKAKRCDQEYHLVYHSDDDSLTVRHPFQCLDPEETLHSRRADGSHGFAIYHKQRNLNGYRRHAEMVGMADELVQSRLHEKRCCLCIVCPRLQRLGYQRQYDDATGLWSVTRI